MGRIGSAGIVGRIVLTIALLVFAALAVGSGLDRMTADSPARERLVPDPLRAQAARSAARVAVARNRADEALFHARDAVLAAPVHPDSAALLGTAQLLAGDGAAADSAFRVAARLGWRNSATQLYWFEAALRVGEGRLAMDRADAILRAMPAFPATDALFTALEDDAAGWLALQDRLAQGPPWLGRYFHMKEDAAEELVARRAAMAVEVAERHRPLGCAAVDAFVRSLLRRGDRLTAEAVWNANCPAASVQQGIGDLDFTSIDQARNNPFGWLPLRSGDVRMERAPEDGGQWRLVLRNNASVSRLFLRQPVALDPGLYRLSAALGVDGRPAEGQVVATWGCGNNAPRPGRVEGSIGGGGQILRVEECGRQQLGLWLRPGGEMIRLGPLLVEKID